MKTFDWCGYTWANEMEGGRIIQSSRPWYWYSSDVITETENGVLSLSIRENPKDIKYWDGKIYHSTYEAATMRSLVDFGYGSFSCQMKMPTGMNLWASFWLTGSGNWPPEIDINESESGDKSCYFRMTDTRFPWINPSWRTTNDVHYRDENLTHNHLGSKNVTIFKQFENPSQHFIEYKCEWLPDKIVFYVNGKVTRTVKGSVCKQLTDNLKEPEKGFKMNVIFNVWCDNPEYKKVNLSSQMLIKNFKYEPF